MQESLLGRFHEQKPGLPRGRYKLPLPEVQAAQRERLIHAVIAVTARDGYGKVAVSDIVAAARVSRAVFYEHFADKEACFLEACLHGLRLLLGAIDAQVGALGEDQPEDQAEGQPEEWLRAGLRGFLGFLAGEPAFARCFLLEMPAAGPEARRRYLSSVELIATMIRDELERMISSSGRGRSLSVDAHLMLAGGVAYLCTARVHADDTASLRQVEGEAMALYRAALLLEHPADRKPPLA